MPWSWQNDDTLMMMTTVIWPSFFFLKWLKENIVKAYFEVSTQPSSSISNTIIITTATLVLAPSG
jgi:hypothetical protein